MKLRVKLLPLVLTMSLGISAQQSRTVHSRALLGGKLSGRIFAVTEGGELKPAIMANVYLFFEVSIHPNGQVNDVDSDHSAGNLFLENTNKEMETELREMQQNGLTEGIQCRGDLLAYQKAIAATLTDVPNSKQWQIVTGQTDENGYFELSIPREGSWMLVAHGQAGANDAIWEQEGVRIFAGKATELKVGSPEKSCLNLDDE